MFNRLLIVVCFVLMCDLLIAQAPYLYFNKLTTQNGLSHNKVNCILQDQRGFIWLGTDDGLNRYDGRYFTSFRHQPNDPSTVSGNIITSLLEDEKGLLWIGTADGGLSRYDYRQPASQQFKQYRHLPNDSSSIPVNIINDLLEDRFGYLWIATGTRWVLRFNKKTEKFEAPVLSGTRNALNICLDKNDILWVGRQGGGILKVNTKNLSYETDSRYDDLYANLPHATVSSLFRDKEDNIWFGSWDKILYRFNAATRKEEKFQQDKNIATTFPNDDILDISEDASGRLWMAGRHSGLTIYDKKEGKFFNYHYDASREGTIADNYINCVYIDRSGMVWLGTGKGVSIYNPLQQPFVQTFLPSKGKDIVIYDFYKDEHNDLWIGTSEGIFIQPSGSNAFQHRPLSWRGHPLIVSHFFKDEDGKFYIGTNFSLFIYNTSDNTISLLPNTEKDPVIYNIIDSRVVSIIRDTIEGHPSLLVSPYGHYLAYYDFTEKKWITRKDSIKNILERFNLKDNLVRNIYKTKQGKIWLATAKTGIGEWNNHSTPSVNYFRNDPASEESVSNDNVYDIAGDNKGNLWLSTYGGGLNYFDVAAKKFRHIEATNNLLEGLQTDEHGKVWMISNGNLHRYDPELNTYSSFMLPDLEKSGGVKGRIYQDDKGTMYVAGNNYFISFQPDVIRSVNRQPKVFFTDFKIFNNSQSELLLNKTIRLRYNQNYFTIEFSAPQFTGGRVEYSYMLEGFDKNWIEAGDRNSVSYSNLEGRNYIFKVRASSKKGNWTGEHAAVNITIIPPFWKRWWFFALAALVVAGAIYGMYRYRINELVKRQTIRNKIAQDLHDNVGSTLSSISVYSQVAKIYHKQQKQDDLQQTLEKIGATSSEMISEMNDIVWAINPRNDNMNVILQRMESYARPLLSAKNISFQFDYDPSLSNMNLPMEQRKNFYLIFKEAVNNALKYSGCRNLYVAIKVSNRRVDLTVRDDGKGFNTAQMKELAAKSLSGNGLLNMKRRAADMKGECTIASDRGKGTTVMLRFLIP
jgi:ligand-binding sensor domain-containing protein/two-component sensor histidine kinase